MSVDTEKVAKKIGLTRRQVCPVCGSEEGTALRMYLKGGWGARRCSGCGKSYKYRAFYECRPMDEPSKGVEQ